MGSGLSPWATNEEIDLSRFREPEDLYEQALQALSVIEYEGTDEPGLHVIPTLKAHQRLKSGQATMWTVGPLGGIRCFRNVVGYPANVVVIRDPSILTGRHRPINLTGIGTAHLPNFQLKEPSRLDRLEAELLSYRDLKEGWDGYSGVPASTQAVDDAVAFLKQRPADISLPYPQLGSDGEVGLYWQTGEVFADVGFRGDGEYSVYASYTGEPATEFAADHVRLDTGAWPLELIRILEKATND